MDIPLGELGAYLKQLAAKGLGEPIERLRVFYRGREILDEDALQECSLAEGHVVQIFLRPAAGAA
jgi:hypothetical protein